MTIVTNIGQNEGHTIVRHTSGRDDTLKAAYADFQNAKNKIVWIVDNKERLKSYDINFDELLMVHSM